MGLIARHFLVVLMEEQEGVSERLVLSLLVALELFGVVLDVFHLFRLDLFNLEYLLLFALNE